MKQSLKSRLSRLEELEQEDFERAKREEFENSPLAIVDIPFSKVVARALFSMYDDFTPEQHIIGGKFVEWFKTTFPQYKDPLLLEERPFPRWVGLHQAAILVRAKADFAEWQERADPQHLIGWDAIDRIEWLSLKWRVFDEIFRNHIPESERHYRLVPVSIRSFKDTPIRSFAIERTKAFPDAGGIITNKLALAFPSRTTVNPIEEGLDGVTLLLEGLPGAEPPQQEPPEQYWKKYDSFELTALPPAKARIGGLGR